jgi:hypothetical protein
VLESSATRQMRTPPIAAIFCLFILLFALYMLAYSGLPHTSDEMAMIAAGQSLSRLGRPSTNQFAWNEFGITHWVSTGMTMSAFEPGQIVLGAALHLIANAFPRVGNVHVVLLANVFVTALTAVLLALYVWELGYGESVALVTALIYGTCTIALPFAKTFFREPLSALFLLLGAYGMLILGRRGSLSGGCLAVVGLGMAAATKKSSLLALPVCAPFFWLYLREAICRRRWRLSLSRPLRLVLGLLLLAGVLIAVVVLVRSELFAPVTRVVRERLVRIAPLQGVALALYGFILSPGKGVFVYTPLFLACFAAFPWFWREHRREALLCGILPLIFLVGYAYTDEHVWWAGLGWGPRFLVPVAPFLTIVLAPLIGRVLDRPLAPASWLFYLLLALSALVQWVGAAFSVGFYSDEISRIRPDGMWTIALFDPGYSAPFFLLRYVEPRNFDFAWAHAWGGKARIDEVVVGVTLGVIVLGGIGLWYSLRRAIPVVPVAATALVLAVALPAFSLPRYYDDPRYLGGADYHALTDYLASAAAPEDVVVLSTHIHTEFFLNYTKGRTDWFAFIRADPLPKWAPEIYTWLLDHHPRLWLVMDNSPEHTNLPKGAERWLTQHAYKLAERSFSQYCRVAAYQGSPRPDPEHPQHLLQIRFGHSIRLLGYDLLRAENPIHPGNLLRLALFWESSLPIKEDYKVTVQLLDESNHLHWQVDRQPADGFRPTYAWPADQPVSDLYVVPLPADLLAGNYRLIVAMYDGRTEERLPVYSSENIQLGDNVELATITVAGE